jgi:hypothetical protein
MVPLLTSRLPTKLVTRWAVPGVLGAVVVLALLLRVVNVTENPPGFFADEAALGYNAYTLLNSGTDEYGEPWPILFRSFDDYKLGISVYAAVPFVAVFGLTELAVRLVGVSFGVLAVITTFLLASAIFKSRAVGLSAAFFLATLPWHIHYSRTGFGEMVSFLPFLTLGLYLFLRGLDKKELWLASGMVLGLTLHTYRSAWVVLPPLILLLGIMYRRELLANWRFAVYSFAIFMFIALPILVHLQTTELDRSQQSGILALELERGELISTVIEQYRAHFTYSFLFEDGDNWAITRHYLPGVGHLFKFQIPLMLLGLLGIAFRPTRSKIIIVALVLLFPLAGALSDLSPISSRSILGTVAAALLAGYGLFVLVNPLSMLNRPYGRVAIGAALAVILVIAGFSLRSYLDRYHTEYPVLSAGYWGWQEGPQEIIEYYVDHQDEYDQLVLDGEFNAPHIFFKFYALNECTRQTCTTGNPDSYRPELRQLFALRPHNYTDAYEYRTVHEIRYPSGELAFSLNEVVGVGEE